MHYTVSLLLTTSSMLNCKIMINHENIKNFLQFGRAYVFSITIKHKRVALNTSTYLFYSIWSNRNSRIDFTQ